MYITSHAPRHRNLQHYKRLVIPLDSSCSFQLAILRNCANSSEWQHALYVVSQILIVGWVTFGVVSVPEANRGGGTDLEWFAWNLGNQDLSVFDLPSYGCSSKCDPSTSNIVSLNIDDISDLT